MSKSFVTVNLDETSSHSLPLLTPGSEQEEEVHSPEDYLINSMTHSNLKSNNKLNKSSVNEVKEEHEDWEVVSKASSGSGSSRLGKEMKVFVEESSNVQVNVNANDAKMGKTNFANGEKIDPEGMVKKNESEVGVDVVGKGMGVDHYSEIGREFGDSDGDGDESSVYSNISSLIPLDDDIAKEQEELKDKSFEEVEVVDDVTEKENGIGIEESSSDILNEVINNMDSVIHSLTDGQLEHHGKEAASAELDKMKAEDISIGVAKQDDKGENNNEAYEGVENESGSKHSSTAPDEEGDKCSQTNSFEDIFQHVDDLLGSSLSKEIGLMDVLNKATKIFGNVSKKILEAGTQTANIVDALFRDADFSQDSPDFLKSIEILCVEKDVVKAIQNFIASQEVADMILDVCRNETLTTERQNLREIVKNHIPDLLKPLSTLLTRCPKLISTIPQLLAAIMEKINVNTNNSNEQSSVADVVLHQGISCDSCLLNPSKKLASIGAGTCVNGNISGVRYKSALVSDFDLCSTCEALGDLDETYGPFLKIRHPKKAPAEIFCVKRDHRSDHFEQKVPDVADERNDEDISSYSDSSDVPGRKFSVLDIDNDEPEVPTTNAKQETIVLKCPLRAHEMRDFLTPNSMFVCDCCNKRSPMQTVMFGCRLCDWDMCVACAKLNNSNMEFEAVKAPLSRGPFFLLHDKDATLKMALINDLRMAHGRHVQTDSNISKGWVVKNTSSWLPWPVDVKLVCVGGHQLAVRNFRQCPLPANSKGEIWIDLKTPDVPGDYVTYFQLQANGQSFGDILKLELFVRKFHRCRKDEKKSKVCDQKWSAALKKLAEMQFTNTKLNIKLLEKVEGDITKVVNRLLKKDEKQDKKASK